MRPWLLLDVDGPLNPYAAPWFRLREPADGFAFHHLTIEPGRSYRVALNPEHGRWLREVASVVDLAWATTWRDAANRLIAPVLGLPQDLPFVPLLGPFVGSPDYGWKTDQVSDWVGNRPFVWLDDEITELTQARLAETAGAGRHLARPVAPDVGLTREDIAAVADFAGSRT